MVMSKGARVRRHEHAAATARLGVLSRGDREALVLDEHHRTPGQPGSEFSEYRCTLPGVEMTNNTEGDRSPDAARKGGPEEVLGPHRDARKTTADAPRSAPARGNASSGWARVREPWSPAPARGRRPRSRQTLHRCRGSARCLGTSTGSAPPVPHSAQAGPWQRTPRMSRHRPRSPRRRLLSRGAPRGRPPDHPGSTATHHHVPIHRRRPLIRREQPSVNENIYQFDRGALSAGGAVPEFRGARPGQFRRVRVESPA